MNNIDIDIVFTYVNGNDENHIKKKNKYAKEKTFIKKHNPLIRTNNIEEITYSVKSVLKYIPWIRNIFIVTDNQIPPIDEKLIKKKKVIIIDHKEIIDNKYLPTFNSDVIESFLHMIPNLSDIFLYNNDDVMHFNDVKRSDIYEIVNDKIKLKMRSKFDLQLLETKETEYSKRVCYTAKILKEIYPDIRLINNHNTKIFRKSSLKRIEKVHKKYIDELRENRFRNDNYINYTFFALNIENLINRNIIIRNPDDILEFHLGNRDYDQKYFDLIMQRKPKFLCLNSMNDTFKEPLKKFMDNNLLVKN